MSTSDYDYFSGFAHSFSSRFPAVAVDGDYYDLPGTTVYHTYTQALPGKGRLEVNLTTPEAAAAFEWTIEITLNDKAAGRFIHIIARRDNSVVETYGKTVIPLTPSRSAEIQALLASL
ncbi:MAG TPA: hypothetical protein VMR75_04180 [Candidatus Saccharimonadales bacterium]|nr:hypothetical protein [Candidatus Saccharimonadales bacterium]